MRESACTTCPTDPPSTLFLFKLPPVAHKNPVRRTDSNPASDPLASGSGYPGNSWPIARRTSASHTRWWPTARS
ncbi:hypothetical protein GCM10009738_42400 [Kitasatospora viridis]